MTVNFVHGIIRIIRGAGAVVYENRTPNIDMEQFDTGRLLFED